MKLDFVSLAQRLGNFKFLCKKEPRVSESFRDSLELLKWEVTPKQVIVFSRFATLVTAVLLWALVTLSLFLNFFSVWWVLSAVALPILILHLTSEYPKMQAKLRIIQAMSDAPITLLFLIIPLKHNPSLEEAVRFAVEYGEGETAEDLRDALWRAWSGKSESVKEELIAIGEKWGKHSPEFKKSLYLIRSSVSEKSEERRLETLERALRSALEGMLTRTKGFIQSLFVPSLTLFSFGTVLPLMFISMLPIMAFFGLYASSHWEIALILAATLIAIFLYSNSIISKKPPTFSQPRVPELPGLPKRGEMQFFKKTVPGWMFATAFIVLVGFPGIIFMLTENPLIHIDDIGWAGLLVNQINTITLVWGVGGAIAIYCWASAKARKKVRDDIKQMDSEVLDAMYQLANRMSESRSPEDAMNYVSDSMPESRIGKIMRDAVNLVKRRNTTLDEALFNEQFGVLKDVHSKTVKSIFRLFASSIRKGIKTASEVLFVMVSHFGELRKAEEELQQMVGRSISMLRATVMFFAPVVCGIIVTLHGVIQKSIVQSQAQLSNFGDTGLTGFFFGNVSAITPEALQLIVGIYMLVLAVILTRYVSLVDNGPDEVAFKTNLSRVIPTALVVFTGVLLASRTLLGGWV
ncbi:hypothetical protein HYS54_02800 [Candidatus Micrarchaeota archaeon]|nr:hypothetical protein [Candidatus Micrarchaeota archaeon]